VKKNQHTENEVLFQKMGNRWYVFTEIGNEFLYAPLPEGMDPRCSKIELCQVIEEHMAKVVRHAQREAEPTAA